MHRSNVAMALGRRLAPALLHRRPAQQQLLLQVSQVRSVLTLKKSPVLATKPAAAAGRTKAKRQSPAAPANAGASARLAKRIAMSGLCSRRDAEKCIEARDVTVNGRVVTDLATVVDVARDVVAVGGRPLAPASELKVWLAHKLPGVRCLTVTLRCCCLLVGVETDWLCMSIHRSW